MLIAVQPAYRVHSIFDAEAKQPPFPVYISRGQPRALTKSAAADGRWCCV